MKVIWDVTLHSQSLFTVKSLINFQICFGHRIKIADTKIGKFAVGVKFGYGM